MTCTDTTDVQRVNVTLLADFYSFRVECVFISGSDAEGCLVILVGDFNNHTLNLTRTNNSAITRVNYYVSCYKEVISFDIEGDGSVGTVAVPGEIQGDFSDLKEFHCQPNGHNGSKLTGTLIIIVQIFLAQCPT